MPSGALWMVECKLIVRSGNYFEFYVSGCQVHVMNALRRIIMSETVTLAIHDVYINQNTSVLPDEVLAQRLGLIPLRVEPEEIDLAEEAAATKPDLRRLARMTARFKLYAKNTSGDIITLYSKDLICVDRKTVKPVYEQIPIVKLGKDQDVDIECIAKVGRGKDHAKWSPVSTVAYKILPKLAVTDACNSCGNCVDSCPFECLKMELGRPVLKGLGLYDCTLCRICVRACSLRALSIEPSNEDFIFRINLIGQLTIEELLHQSKIIFETKLDDIVRKVEEALSASGGSEGEKSS